MSAAYLTCPGTRAILEGGGEGVPLGPRAQTRDGGGSS